jgi:hypothetical protein
MRITCRGFPRHSAMPYVPLEKMMLKARTVWVVLCFVLLASVLSCCKSGDNSENDQTPPLLSATPISLVGPYNSAAKTFGDVTFNHDHALIPFGAPLTSTTLNCGFEYYTTASATVRASCGGEIVYMFKNEGIDDWEIHIKSSPSARWSVQHDHVSNPVVQQGDQVHAGDALGGTGKWNWAQNIGRTELIVTYSEGPGTDLCYCPMNYGTTEFVQDHNNLLAAMNGHGFGPYTSFCLAETVVP